MDRSRIGVVIPAFNESATIENIVKAVEKYGLPIVVDDGSIDNTAELAKRAGAVVITHANNSGYDSALNSGFIKASELGMDIIITLDADGQHDPSLVQKFVNMIDEGSDIVVGERNEQHRISERLFAWWTRIWFGIKDPLCGMKAYRSSVYDMLGHFDSYNSIGTELMIFAAKRRLVIGQISIIVRDRDGRPRFGNMISANYKIMRAMLCSLWCVRR